MLIHCLPVPGTLHASEYREFFFLFNFHEIVRNGDFDDSDNAERSDAFDRFGNS